MCVHTCRKERVRFEGQGACKFISLFCWWKAVVPGVLEFKIKIEVSVGLFVVPYGLWWYWEDNTKGFWFFSLYSLPFSQNNSITPTWFVGLCFSPFHLFCVCHWNIYATVMDFSTECVSHLLLCSFIQWPVCLGTQGKIPSYRHLYLFVLWASIMNLVLYYLELIWIVKKLCQFLLFTFLGVVIFCLWCHKFHKLKHLRSSFQGVYQQNMNILYFYLSYLVSCVIYLYASVLYSLSSAERIVFI